MHLWVKQGRYGLLWLLIFRGSLCHSASSLQSSSWGSSRAYDLWQSVSEVWGHSCSGSSMSAADKFIYLYNWRRGHAALRHGAGGYWHMDFDCYHLLEWESWGKLNRFEQNFIFKRISQDTSLLSEDSLSIDKHMWYTCKYNLYINSKYRWHRIWSKMA